MRLFDIGNEVYVGIRNIIWPNSCWDRRRDRDRNFSCRLIDVRASLTSASELSETWTDTDVCFGHNNFNFLAIKRVFSKSTSLERRNRCNMAEETDENAALRTELVRLRATVAAQSKEIEDLKALLELLRCSGPAGDASTAAQDGNVPGSSSEALPDRPVFPNELFILISRFLEPGTRPLLNLARTCRSLYELLLPDLYAKFSIEGVYKKASMAARDGNVALILPHGLALVQSLDARFSPEAELDIRLNVALGCRRAVKMQCDMQIFRMLVAHDGAVFQYLETLELDVDTDEDALYEFVFTFANRPYHGMPNLRNLKISGEPCIELMQMFVNSCPLLNWIDADFSGHEFSDGWDPRDIPQEFAAKIRRWHFYHPESLFLIAAHFPCFQPEELNCTDRDFELSPQHWRFFCTMPSIRRLYLPKMDSVSLLSGTPKSLELLSIHALRPSIWTLDADSAAATLDQLSAWLVSLQPKTKLLINQSVSQMVTIVSEWAKLNVYRAELKIWKNVPGFKTHASWERLEDLDQRIRQPVS